MILKKPIPTTTGTARQRFTKTLGILALATVGFSLDPAQAATTPPVMQSVTLGWNAVPEAITGYRVHVGTQSRQYTGTYDTGSQPTFTSNSLGSGQTYYFAVSAIGSTGLEGLLSDEVVVTTATPVPVVTLHTLTLGWDAVSETGITGYRVHVGTQSRQYTGLHDTGLQTTFPVGGLEFGQTYYFVVSAIGSTGLESAVSDEIAVTVAPPPLPVGGRMVSNGSGQPSLQWTFRRADLGSSPAFIVQASSDLVHWTQVDTVLPGQATGGDAQNLQFAWPVAITTGNRMFYRLTAKNWVGQSVAQ